MLLSPTSTQYLVGTPWRFLTGSCEGAYASQISLMTKQTLFFVCLSFARLLLLPKRTKVSFGGTLPLENSENFIININLKKSEFWCDYTSPIKRREFDGFLGFFAGFENPSVLSVHEFSGSAKTPKRRELSPFYKKNFGRAHVCSPRRLPEIISKCYDCGNAACW